MSKITFRADDDLVDQLEALDRSKSEAMREALREYLEGDGSDAPPERDGEPGIDDLVRARVDERLETRLREFGLDATNTRPGDRATEPRDVEISISLEGAQGRSIDDARIEDERARERSSDERRPESGRADERTAPRADADEAQCTQCGESLAGDHVYCPNCGEKASRRLFCDCGDEVRSDWSFCPGCGRRTPAADVLDADGHQY